MAKTAVAEKPKASGGTAAKPADPGAEPVGMGKAELKRMLKFAQQAPVRIAFALGADGKAIVLMDRRKPPRALEKELKDAAPDSRNHRFGMVALDANDAKLVRLTVNKSAPGMGRRLVVAFKGTGFSKVEVGTEDGAPPEQAEEPEEDEATQSTRGNGSTPAGKGAKSQGAEERDGADAKSDTGELVAKLTPKVRQMLEFVGKHPEQKAPLQKLATAAQASLRGAMLTLEPGNLDKASADIDRFCKAVDDAAKASGTSRGGFLAGIGAADLKGIGAAVTELAKRGLSLVPTNPALKDVLRTHLPHAKAALESGDLDKATQHKDALAKAVDAASGSGGAGSRDGSGPGR